jgi:putative transposase
MVTPAARREAVAHLKVSLEVSERRACTMIAADRSAVRYRSRRPDDADLRGRLRELADQRRRFGYRRLHILLRDEGHALVRRRRSRRRIAVARPSIPRPTGPNRRWSTDFVHDQLADGRRFRVLTIVDDVAKGCLAAIPDTSLTGKRVVREMGALIARRGRGGRHRQRQRRRVHLLGRSGLHPRGEARLALHRAGQADRERLRRELLSR